MTEAIDLAALMSAFLLGLFSSGHCLGMCGGLIGAFSAALPQEKTAQQKLLLLLSYNVGRVSMYAAAGTLVGLFGQQLLAFDTEFFSNLRILAALLLILMGLYVGGWFNLIRHVERVGELLWRQIYPRLKPLFPPRKLSSAYLLGIAWGWLPCGLVYSSLIVAFSQGSSLASGLFMLSFGLGTLPPLLAFALFNLSFANFYSTYHLKTLSALAILIYGLWSLASVFIDPEVWLPGPF